MMFRTITLGAAEVPYVVPAAAVSWLALTGTLALSTMFAAALSLNLVLILLPLFVAGGALTVAPLMRPTSRSLAALSTWHGKRRSAARCRSVDDLDLGIPP